MAQENSGGKAVAEKAGLLSLSRAAQSIQHHPGYTLRIALDPDLLIAWVDQELPRCTDAIYRLMADAVDPDLLIRLGLPASAVLTDTFTPRQAAVLAVSARLYYMAALQAIHGDVDDPQDRPSWFLGRGVRDTEQFPVPGDLARNDVRIYVVDYRAYPETGEIVVVYSNGDPDFCEEAELVPDDPCYVTAKRLYDWRVAYEARQAESRRLRASRNVSRAA